MPPCKKCKLVKYVSSGQLANAEHINLAKASTD